MFRTVAIYRGVSDKWESSGASSTAENFHMQNSWETLSYSPNIHSWQPLISFPRSSVDSQSKMTTKNNSWNRSMESACSCQFTQCPQATVPSAVISVMVDAEVNQVEKLQSSGTLQNTVGLENSGRGLAEGSRSSWLFSAAFCGPVELCLFSAEFSPWKQPKPFPSSTCGSARSISFKQK